MVRSRLLGPAALYFRLAGARVRADWQYPMSVVLFTIGQFLAAGLEFIAILLLFGRVRSLAGWSLYEVLFLYATSGISFGLGDVLVSPVERVAVHIRQGSFDQFLLRPVGPLLQLTCEDFALRRVGRLVQPTAALVIALAHLPTEWTGLRIAVLASMLLSGAVIFSSLWIAACAMAFWTVETQEVANSFTYGGAFAAEYPLDILGGWLRRVVVFVPLAFVNYLPAGWILGKPDGLAVGGWARLASPVVALASAVAGASVWRSAVRHYRSTGS